MDDCTDAPEEGSTAHTADGYAAYIPETDEERARLGDASYDPEDNKLRMRPYARLDKATYDRMKAAGFSWAPKQELFVAGMWTPERADLLTELCGDIGDEDTSLVERAEERADRFDDYRQKRAQDADRAHKAVSAIADNIPLGQPILVGHHSEKHARKDAERIENGMRKAVKMWETSEYWKSRARGALAHARYKELPAVRHRRIKGLEADQRKHEKSIKEAGVFLKMWRQVDDPKSITRKGEPVSLKERALFIANHGGYLSRCFPLADYPRDPPASQYEGPMSLWGALDDNIISPEQARDIAISCYERGIAIHTRWLAHIANRLEYERAMLDEGGGLAADKFEIVPGGRVLTRFGWHVVKRVNRVGGRINSLTLFGQGWKEGIEGVKEYEPPKEGAAEKVKAATKLAPLVNYPGEGFRHMTKATYDSRAKHSDFWHIKKMDASEKFGAHRIRHASPEHGSAWDLVPVYLTDEKRKDPPPPTAAPAIDRAALAPEREIREPRSPREEDPAAAEFASMKESLKAGVQAVAVPQLFVTPPDLARRIVEMADVEGRTVLEPSAGLGALAIECHRQGAKTVHCIDSSEACVQALRTLRDQGTITSVGQADFLSATFEPVFQRIVMNPPFAGCSDIDHVTHAFRHWLAPGGRLVAIMSAGTKFRQDKKTAAFRVLVEAHGGTIEDLPEDAFKSSGTSVRTVVVVIDKGE